MRTLQVVPIDNLSEDFHPKNNKLEVTISPDEGNALSLSNQGLLVLSNKGDGVNRRLIGPFQDESERVSIGGMRVYLQIEGDGLEIKLHVISDDSPYEVLTNSGVARKRQDTPYYLVNLGVVDKLTFILGNSVYEIGAQLLEGSLAVGWIDYIGSIEDKETDLPIEPPIGLPEYPETIEYMVGDLTKDDKLVLVYKRDSELDEHTKVCYRLLPTGFMDVDNPVMEPVNFDSMSNMCYVPGAEVILLANSGTHEVIVGVLSPDGDSIERSHTVYVGGGIDEAELSVGGGVVNGELIILAFHQGGKVCILPFDLDHGIVIEDRVKLINLNVTNMMYQIEIVGDNLIYMSGDHPNYQFTCYNLTNDEYMELHTVVSDRPAGFISSINDEYVMIVSTASSSTAKLNLYKAVNGGVELKASEEIPISRYFTYNQTRSTTTPELPGIYQSSLVDGSELYIIYIDLNNESISYNSSDHQVMMWGGVVLSNIDNNRGYDEIQPTVPYLEYFQLIKPK